VKLPLLRSADPQRPVLWSHGRVIPAGELMQQVAAVAKALPDGRHLINLCEHRDNFLIACCAALIRGHTNLLPSTRAEGVVEEVAAMHPGSYRCDDELVRAACEAAASGRDAGGKRARGRGAAARITVPSSCPAIMWP
jgi:hypothetical protein